MEAASVGGDSAEAREPSSPLFLGAAEVLTALLPVALNGAGESEGASGLRSTEPLAGTTLDASERRGAIPLFASTGSVPSQGVILDGPADRFTPGVANPPEPEAPPPAWELGPIVLDLPGGVAVAGALALDSELLEAGVRGILDHIAGAATDWLDGGDNWQWYAWLATAAMLTAWAGYALWENRKRSGRLVAGPATPWWESHEERFGR